MPIHRGIMGGVALVPAVTTDAVQQFNQDRASFVCYAYANDYLTTVSFQYNTTNNWSSYTTVSAGTTVGQNQMMYYNITGLSIGTTYYVRAVAQSDIGITIGNVVSFTTWSLKTYLKTTSGSYSVSLPSITPIGGSAVAPSVYEMLIYGGGGGAANGGGGGGGYRLFSSHSSSTSGAQTISGSIGIGGTGGSTGTPGGNSTITVGGTTWTAGGGYGGGWLTNAAGSVGTGDNPGYAGGTGYYGVIVGYNQYQCGTEKNGNPIYCPDYNSPIYDYGQYAGGGGGGTNSAGANGGSNIGGQGGTGGGAYGLRGGNGGGGQGSSGSYGEGSVPSGSGPIVGIGGTGYGGHGVAGGVTFKYYGP